MIDYLQVALIGAIDHGFTLLVRVPMQFVGKVMNGCLKVSLFRIDHDRDAFLLARLKAFIRPDQQAKVRFLRVLFDLNVWLG